MELVICSLCIIFLHSYLYEAVTRSLLATFLNNDCVVESTKVVSVVTEMEAAKVDWASNYIVTCRILSKQALGNGDFNWHTTLVRQVFSARVSNKGFIY
jgi:hypothetical protein